MVWAVGGTLMKHKRFTEHPVTSNLATASKGLGVARLAYD